MRFRVYVYLFDQGPSGSSFVQAGAGSNAFDGALLGQIRDAMTSSATAVYFADTTAFTITRLR